MKNTKILVVGFSSTTGGVEKEIIGIANNCPDITFEFLCFGNKENYKNEFLNDKNVYFIPSRRKNLFKSNSEQKNFFINNKKTYDFIWINTASASNITTHKYAKKYTDAKVITHSHNSKIECSQPLLRVIHYIKHKTNRHKLVKLTDIFFTCSKLASNHLYGNINNEIYRINNGTDISKFSFDENERNKIRKNYNISDDDFLLGNIGRIIKTKNPFFMINILEKLLEENDNYKLMLVGNGAQKKEIETYIKKRNIEDKVILAGFQKEPYKFLNAMDCFLLPSLFEGLPLSVVEAQANGLYCLVSDTVTDEVNMTGEVKYLSINKKNIIDWVENINKNDIEKRPNYSSNDKIKEFDFLYSAYQFKTIIERHTK